MLMNEPKLHKGLLWMLESKEVVKVVPEPSFEGTLGSGFHEVESLNEQEG